MARPTTYVRKLFGAALDADTDYTLKVTALSAYGKQAEVGEIVFHTENAIEA